MPTIEITTKRKVAVKYLQAECGVRYWDDATVNGVQAPEDGEGVPLKDGDAWAPIIDLDTGIILDWPQGTTMETHFKVCDAGRYKLLDADKSVVCVRDDYVPGVMCPEGGGYGDYVIMTIDAEGRIANFDNDLSDFQAVEG